MRRTDEPLPYRPTRRTSQIIFGERQYLRAVLQSVQHFQVKDDRFDQEKNLLHELIEARTAELNRINPEWDHKFSKARKAETSAEDLESLARSAPEDDYLLVRSIAENPNTPSSVLAGLALHPYDAVRENVARHPTADAQTLELLAADPKRPLWFLVACNQGAPQALREKLQPRMRQASAGD